MTFERRAAAGLYFAYNCSSKLDDGPACDATPYSYTLNALGDGQRTRRTVPRASGKPLTVG